MKMQDEKLIIIGAGSLGIMTLDVVLNEGNYAQENIFFVDDRITRHEHVYGIPVIGDVDSIENLDMSKFKFIIAIANNKIRKKIAEKYNELTYVNAIHPKASVSKLSKIGVGNIILPNAAVDPETIIHNHVIINKNTSLGHNVEMEDYSQVSPGSQLGGLVKMAAFLGMGSTLLPNIKVGRYTTVGAGSVVVNDLPDDCTAIGIPAKPIKFHNEIRN